LLSQLSMLIQKEREAMSVNLGLPRYKSRSKSSQKGGVRE